MIGYVRGRDQPMGIELVRDRAIRQPAATEGREIGRICFENCVIFSLRRDGSVLRFVRPATTTELQIARFADILGRAMETVSTAGNRHAVRLPADQDAPCPGQPVNAEVPRLASWRPMMTR